MEEREKSKKKKRNKKNNSNSPMLVITYLFIGIFACMIWYYVDFQVNKSANIINSNYNTRQEILEESIIRGSILSNDGKILAKTVVEANGNSRREYPYGTLFSHSVGFSTHGKTGIEQIANFKLLTSNISIAEIASDDIKGEKHYGDNVFTSLDVEVTKAAYSAMEDNQGAVIAIEPTTGKIVAMVSKPDFDPNTIDDIYDTLVSDNSNSNLLNRATSGLYTPGSTFKVFTLLEYIHENPNYENYSYKCKGSIEHNGTKISCANGKWHGNEDLLTSFANSCNSSFVNIGLGLDLDRFKELCDSLMFNSDLPLEMSYKSSNFVLNSQSSEFDIMQTAMGQGKTLCTPAHLAMVAAAVANDGVLMKTYMITEVQNHKGIIVSSTVPEKYKTLLSSEDANTLKKFMRAVVTDGTGRKLNVDDYTAYGKTGTAQINDGSQSNSLFMGYAEKGDKKLAICVVLEDMPEGSTPAVPVAKEVFDAYFSE